MFHLDTEFVLQIPCEIAFLNSAGDPVVNRIIDHECPISELKDRSSCIPSPTTSQKHRFPSNWELLDDEHQAHLNASKLWKVYGSGDTQRIGGSNVDSVV